MYSNKKMIWIIVVLALGLALFVTLKTISISERTAYPRGVLVGRNDYFGC